MNFCTANWTCAIMKMEGETTHPYTLIGKRGKLLKQNNLSKGINNELKFIAYNQVQDIRMHVNKSDEYNKTFRIF